MSMSLEPHMHVVEKHGRIPTFHLSNIPFVHGRIPTFHLSNIPFCTRSDTDIPHKGKHRVYIYIYIMYMSICLYVYIYIYILFGGRATFAIYIYIYIYGSHYCRLSMGQQNIKGRRTWASS